MACDPQTLANLAKCIEQQISPGMQLPVVISLLCTIAANAGGGGGGAGGICGVGSPVGTVNATACAQIYVDTSTGNLWISTATGTGNWTQFLGNGADVQASSFRTTQGTGTVSVSVVSLTTATLTLDPASSDDAVHVTIATTGSTSIIGGGQTYFNVVWATPHARVPRFIRVSSLGQSAGGGPSLVGNSWAMQFFFPTALTVNGYSVNNGRSTTFVPGASGINFELLFESVY